MSPTFVTKGYIEVWSAGRLVSQHTQETKAVEALLAHASTSETDTTYELRFPLKIVKVPGVRHPRTDTTAPTVPENLSATVLSSTSVRLDWEASTDTVGVAGYQVWRNAAPIETTTSLSYTAIGLTAATAYEFNVSAYDAAGNMSALSETVTATTSGSSNAAPVWQSIAQQELTTGTNYSLPIGSFVSDPEGQAVTVVQVSGVLPTGVTYNASTKVVSGTPTATSTPTVTFRASDGTNTADISIVFNCLGADTTAPSVPAGLAGTGISRQRIDLTWSASSDTAGTGQRSSGLAGYRLYRDGSLRTTLGPGVTNYSDTGLATGTSYSYTIAAVDAAGNASAQSAAIVVSTATNAEPEWVTPATLPETAHPLASDVTMRLLATDDDGDPITYSYDEPLPTGYAITELTNPLGALLTIAAGTAAGTVSFTAHAVDTTTSAAQADWDARTGGAGVVWAHTFATAYEVDNFRIRNDLNQNDPQNDFHVAMPYRASVSMSAGPNSCCDVYHSTDGPIAGQGSLVIRVPAADEAFERFVGNDCWRAGDNWYVAMQAAFGLAKPGLPIFLGVWRRPFAALNGNGDPRRGNGTGDPDINNAGKTPREFRPWVSEGGSPYATAEFRHGFYTHADYKTATEALNQTWDGDEYYIQYRMKMPSTRYQPTRQLPAYTGAAGARFYTNTGTPTARPAPQKLMWISTDTRGEQAQELVLSGLGRLTAAGGDYDAPYGFAGVYGSKQINFPDATGGRLIDPATGGYMTWPTTWITFMHRVKCGHSGPSTSSVGGDGIVQTWVARDGGPFVLMQDCQTIRWAFSGSGDPTHSYGWNCWEPTGYTNFLDELEWASPGGSPAARLAYCRDPSTRCVGAASNSPSTQQTYEIKFSQIIFSTQYIPPPGAGA
jgi:chitodextrinase